MSYISRGAEQRRNKIMGLKEDILSSNPDERNKALKEIEDDYSIAYHIMNDLTPDETLTIIEYIRKGELSVFIRYLEGAIEKLSEEDKISCIKDKQLKLTKFQIKEIILTLSEENKINCIKDNELELDELDVQDVILTLSEENKISCIKDKELDKFNIRKIIVTLSEENRISCMKDKELGLDEFRIKEIILTLSDENKIECAKDQELGLDASIIEKLVLTLSEENKVKCIKDPELGLGVSTIKKVVLTLSDENKIKCAKDEELDLYAPPIIETLEYDENKIKCVRDEDFKFSNSDISSILGTLKSEKYIIEAFESFNGKINGTNQFFMITKLPHATRINLLKNDKITLDKKNISYIIKIGIKESEQELFDVLREDNRLDSIMLENEDGALDIVELLNKNPEFLNKFREEEGNQKTPTTVKLCDIQRGINEGAEIAEHFEEMSVSEVSFILPRLKMEPETRELAIDRIVEGYLEDYEYIRGLMESGIIPKDYIIKKAAKDIASKEGIGKLKGVKIGETVKSEKPQNGEEQIGM